MRIWKSWDEEERTSAVRIAGLCVAALTLFIFIATFSYLFHWREDMSLLGDPDAMQADRAVGNAAGKLGFKTGYLLVCNLVGLGSFSLLLILAAVSIRLLARNWPKSLLKTTLIALFGAFISSLPLAFVGKLAGLDTLFGGGLGGRCGSAVIDWAENLFGPVVTGLFIVILIAAFLFFASKRFNHWFSTIGQPKDKPEDPETDEPETPAVPENDLPDEPEPGLDSDLFLPDDTQDGPAPEPDKPVVTIQKQEPETGVPGGEKPDEGSFTIITDDEGLEAENVEDLQPIDNRLDPPDGLPKYKFPSLDLLESYASGRHEVSTEELTRNNNKIRAALANYKIQVTDVKAIVCPTVTL